MRKEHNLMFRFLFLLVLLILSSVVVSCNSDNSGSAVTVSAPAEADNVETENEGSSLEEPSSEESSSETPSGEVTSSEEGLPSLGEPSSANEPSSVVEYGSAALEQPSTTDDKQFKSTDVSSTLEYELETRAIWSRLGAQGTVTRSDLDKLVAKVDEANLNVILLAIYKESAFFETSQMRFPDEALRLPNRSNFEDDEYKDALSYLLSVRDERRHDTDPTNDFEVHAWFNVHFGGRRGDEFPFEDLTEPWMLNGIFPEFKLILGRYYPDGNVGFIDHRKSVVQQPMFRNYMANLIAGLVEDYDVDGVHLDHIRTSGICFNNEPLDYPGDEFDFPGCQEDYKNYTREEFGQEHSLWDDTDGHRTITDQESGRVASWLEHSVRLLVKEIHDEVKLVNPDMTISVASVRNNPDVSVRNQSQDGQVAYEWLQEGLIDAAFITLYSEDTEAVLKQIRNYVEAIPDLHKRSLVFPGLATSNVDGDKAERTDLLREQVEVILSSQVEGVEDVGGVALFRSRFFNEQAIDLLADGPFKEEALPYWGQQPTGMGLIETQGTSSKR